MENDVLTKLNGLYITVLRIVSVMIISFYV